MGNLIIDEKFRHILEKRALELAKNIDTETRLKHSNEDLHLIFKLGGSRFGIKIEHITEVIQLKNFVPVPCTPSHIYGVIRLRGRVIALVNLISFWEKGETGISDNDRAIVVNLNGVSFGIICASINEVQSIDKTKMKPPPANFDSVAVKFIKGIMPDWSIILDLPSIVREPGFLVNEKVTAQKR